MSSTARLNGDRDGHDRAGPVEWYETRVLPAVFQRLDEVFPEFGWRRDARGWVATNRDTTKRLFDARPDRVVCHQSGGLYIHGHDRGISWSAYLNAGSVPTGADFVRVARDLAERAGVPTDAIDAAGTRSRRVGRGSRLEEVRADYFVLCRAVLADAAASAPQRAYLRSRGIDAERAVADGLLGVAPPRAEASRLLNAAGYSRAELDAAGVLADGRWEARIVGAWHEDWGAVGTLWARSIDVADEQRYLYLRGATKPALPYLAADALARDAAAPWDRLLVVEGVLDAVALHQHGMTVAALGGSTATPATWEALGRVGIDQVTLLLDRDTAGLDATRRATDTLMRASQSPLVLVANPRRVLGTYKDPAALLAAAGPDAVAEAKGLMRRVEQTAEAAIVWRVAELTDPRRSEMTERRDRVVDQVVTLLAAAPDRFAVERHDALRLAATRLRVEPDGIARLAGLAPDSKRSRAAVERSAQRVAELELALTQARGTLLRLALPWQPEAGELPTYLTQTQQAAARAARDATASLNQATPAVSRPLAARPVAERPRGVPSR